MEIWMLWLKEVFPGIVGASPLDFFVLGANLLVLIFARELLVLMHFDKDGEQRFLLRLRALRLLTLLLFAVYGQMFMAGSASREGWHYQLLMVVATIYAGFLFDFVVHYFIKRRFGRERQVDDEKQLIETYNSRLLSILARIFIFIVVLLTVVRVLGYDSMLEAGGIIGFVGVFLALTQGSWAPDIFGGLIILNSSVLEEGDVVQVPGIEDLVCVVFKTRMFHTELLSVQYNHRIMVRNAKLRDCVVHNLSRFASARGLRERLCFKIPYGSDHNAVRGMFDEAFEAAAEQGVVFESQHPVDVVTLGAGDFAVDWAVYYHIKDIRHLFAIRQALTEQVVEAAAGRGIELQTPVMNQLILNPADTQQAEASQPA